MTEASKSAPPRGKRPGAPGARKAKSPRRRARETAVQGLYQWLVAGTEAAEIDAHMRENEAFGQCDSAHFDALLHGCIREAAQLDEVLALHVDRATQALSPVEHAILLVGLWELTHSLEVPYKVVINEGVELAKEFGGTDGHKYVNGVLDKAAAELRQVEVAAMRQGRA